MAMVLLLDRVPRIRLGSAIVAALVLHVVNMVAPQVFRPLAPLWFGVAHLLGDLVAHPVVTRFRPRRDANWRVRRALGKDSLRLRAFGAGDESVMVVRNHTFNPGDLENPY